MHEDLNLHISLFYYTCLEHFTFNRFACHFDICMNWLVTFMYNFKKWIEKRSNWSWEFLYIFVTNTSFAWYILCYLVVVFKWTCACPFLKKKCICISQTNKLSATNFSNVFLFCYCMFRKTKVGIQYYSEQLDFRTVLKTSTVKSR